MNLDHQLAIGMNLTQSIFYHCFKLHTPQHPRKQPTIAQAGERHGTVPDGLGRKRISSAITGRPCSGHRGERQPLKTTPEFMLSKRSKHNES
jgi:hypothetical protein